MSKIEITGPESFIEDAAEPLWRVISELHTAPRGGEAVKMAQWHLSQTIKFLKQAYEQVR